MLIIIFVVILSQSRFQTSIIREYFFKVLLNDV